VWELKRDVLAGSQHSLATADTSVEFDKSPRRVKEKRTDLVMKSCSARLDAKAVAGLWGEVE